MTGEPRTWTIRHEPGNREDHGPEWYVDEIDGPVTEGVEVVERSVLGRVEEERDALRFALEKIVELAKVAGKPHSSATNLGTVGSIAGAALSASHAAQPDRGMYRQAVQAENDRLRAAIRSIQARYERRERLHTSDFTAAITGSGG